MVGCSPLAEGIAQERTSSRWTTLTVLPSPRLLGGTPTRGIQPSSDGGDGRVWCAQTQPAHPPAPSPTPTVAPPQSAPLAASQGIDTGTTDVVAATTPTAVRSEVPYRGRVEAEFDAPLEVARWRVIGNPILAIPHLLILAVLLAVCFCCIYLLFVIDLLVGWLLFAMSARIPLGVYDFLEAMQRYEWRVVTFVLFLREKYPPFSFEASMFDPRDDPARISFLKRICSGTQPRTCGASSGSSCSCRRSSSASRSP